MGHRRTEVTVGLHHPLSSSCIIIIVIKRKPSSSSCCCVSDLNKTSLVTEGPVPHKSRVRASKGASAVVNEPCQAPQKFVALLRRPTCLDVVDQSESNSWLIVQLEPWLSITKSRRSCCHERD
mmetsp:Transcript_10455/g.23120  ORF Transcript_10455/g.23120 Transcript_10455/m.23120 type:complete len:123 (+) Transcript_10455:336-704(+)